MESPTSSAISISSVPSDISDVNQQVSDVLLSHADTLVLDLNGKQLFDPGDGDMELMVNETRFETHRYLIKRFKKWGDLNPKLQPGSVVTVTGTASPDDFCRMLRVLYATTLEGPFEFDTSTLISALHIATEYEYPALRNYAIRHLEQVELTAIKRIEIARKFNVPLWEKPAFVDLCNRDEAVTEEEATILGMAAFVRVAKIREKEQRRRGREMDIEWEQEITESEGPDVDNINEEIATQVQLSGGEEPPKEALLRLGSGIGKRIKKAPRKAKRGEQAVGLEVTMPEVQGQVETPETKLQPSFIDIPTTGRYKLGEYSRSEVQQVGIQVPRCSCCYSDGLFMTAECCILPACAVAAFKNLQIEQLAHTKSIAILRSSVSELHAASKPHSACDTQNLTNPSMHEEVQVMLSELS